MREILFRGKRLCNGAWVLGGFHSRFDRAFIIGCSKSLRIDGTEVVPETVGQYIGLTDKNGKRIFEGDILQYTSTWTGATHIEGVIVAETWNCSCCNGVFGFALDGGDIRDHDQCEIIGNIHDNPELVGGGSG